MKKILLLFLLAGLLYACKKDDKIGTKPVIAFKSYSADAITKETQVFVVTLSVQDGDGDIEDSLGIAILKDSEQQISSDTLWTYLTMPDIGQNNGNNVKADVEIPLGNEQFAVNYTPAPNDSAHFVVYIKDNAGHISDTIATPKFPFTRNQ